jgi:hypothetical protein
MKKRLMPGLLAILILVHVAIPHVTEAATVAQEIKEVFGCSVALDSARFPDSVMIPFVNDAQTSIATMGRTKERQTTFVLTTGQFAYPLPSDFYVVEAVIINRDWAGKDEPDNHAFALQIVPRRELGKSGMPPAMRPSQVSKWNDSLVFDKDTKNDLDTITVDYFARPVILDAVTDTIDLPDVYLPLLKDYVLAKCYDRIQLQGPPRTDTEARIKMQEQTLLGRPADEK